MLALRGLHVPPHSCAPADRRPARWQGRVLFSACGGTAPWLGLQTGSWAVTKSGAGRTQSPFLPCCSRGSHAWANWTGTPRPEMWPLPPLFRIVLIHLYSQPASELLQWGTSPAAHWPAHIGPRSAPPSPPRPPGCRPSPPTMRSTCASSGQWRWLWGQGQLAAAGLGQPPFLDSGS